MTPGSGGRHAAPPPEGPQGRILRIGGAALLVASMIVVVSAIYLHPFLADARRLPHGVDTSVYIFGSRTVYDLGLEALSPFGERPAHPILTSVLRDLSGGAPLDLARVEPAVLAVAIASAGLALGAGAARERLWVAVAVGVGLAASPFIALTAVGYASNLLFDVFAVAAIAVAVRVASGGGGAGALVLLIAAAVIAHWMFAIGLILLLGLYGGVLLVGEIRRRSAGAPPGRHAARFLVVVGVAAVLGGGALLLSPERPTKLPSTTLRVGEKISTRLPAMELPIAIPLACIGAATMMLAGSPAVRRTAVPLAIWASAAPVGLLAWQLLGVDLPHRIVPVALGIPLLIVLGAAAARSWLRVRSVRAGAPVVRSAGVVTGVILVIAAAAWLARSGAETWGPQEAGFTDDQLRQATILAAYLEPLPADTKVLVPVDAGRWRPLRALQVVLPVERMRHVRAWGWDLGLGEERLRRRLAWKFPGNTVVVYLRDYSEQPEPRGTELGPGVVLVVGPTPLEPLSLAPIGTTVAGELIRVTALSIVVLLIVGLGWTMVLANVSPIVAIGLSPAIGSAMVAVGGLVFGRLGVPLGRGGGVLVATSLAVLGWTAFALRAWVGSPPPAADPDHAGSSSTTEVAASSGRGRHMTGQRRVGLE